MFPAAHPGGSVVMSVNPRDCKIVKKSGALPELFNLKLVEANYKGDPKCVSSRNWLRARILSLSGK